MNTASPTDTLMQRLLDADAPQRDAVGWHYIETLAQRSQAQSGPAQALLQDKLLHTLQDLEQRLASAPAKPDRASMDGPSALAQLLQEMAPPALPAQEALAASRLEPQRESPRVRQFRKQLRQISVQKRVSKAIAQAPHNAGPINSHMLVLRALGLMRDISPDYLNRFMTHADTLLCLQASERAHQTPTKNKSARSKK
jgi:hypothetical protein